MKKLNSIGLPFLKNAPLQNSAFSPLSTGLWFCSLILQFKRDRRKELIQSLDLSQYSPRKVRKLARQISRKLEDLQDYLYVIQGIDYDSGKRIYVKNWSVNEHIEPEGNVNTLDLRALWSEPIVKNGLHLGSMVDSQNNIEAFGLSFRGSFELLIIKPLDGDLIRLQSFLSPELIRETHKKQEPEFSRLQFDNVAINSVTTLNDFPGINYFYNEQLKKPPFIHITSLQLGPLGMGIPPVQGNIMREAALGSRQPLEPERTINLTAPYFYLIFEFNSDAYVLCGFVTEADSVGESPVPL